nr:RNA-binding protein MEX3D [Pelodiscus sinensis]|eukprot:XP_025043500.1 RNA-binding protein MEX3D [Pelodiscus sinensis]
MTECVPVPSSEHVAEIVGRQGCKIKALRAKTNTYIKTPVRGEEPIFIVTGRKEDVEMAKREILSAAEHFSMIRATRNKVNGLTGTVPGPPNLPGQTTIQVRVPYRVVGLVVGPKGATIKRIQQQTHTYIVTPSRDKEPVFEVTGMPENVDRAREEIEAHITMRTGSFIDINADNDFHSNGTDVCLDPGLPPPRPESGVALEHPLPRRIQSDPVSTLSWLPTQGSLSSFSNSTGYSSSSSLPGSISGTSGSPTDSSSSDGHRKSSRECMVCFESEVIAALVPCGHNLFCMECAIRICGKAEPGCPACHTPATQAIHIFS